MSGSIFAVCGNPAGDKDATRRLTKPGKKKKKNGEKPPVNLNEILKQVDMNAFKENKTKQRLHKQQDDDIKRPN